MKQFFFCIAVLVCTVSGWSQAETGEYVMLLCDQIDKEKVLKSPADFDQYQAELFEATAVANPDEWAVLLEIQQLLNPELDLEAAVTPVLNMLSRYLMLLCDEYVDLVQQVITDVDDELVVRVGGELVEYISKESAGGWELESLSSKVFEQMEMKLLLHEEDIVNGFEGENPRGDFVAALHSYLMKHSVPYLRLSTLTN